MIDLKPGVRLQSTVCTTEAIVISGMGQFDVQCGGAPMALAGSATVQGSPSADAANGTQLGKRYSDPEDTVVLLCTKAGDGSLAAGGIALDIQQAKQLPASD